MKLTRILTLAFFAVLIVTQAVYAQTDAPLAVVLTADGPIMPPMLEYIKRGVESAERRNAEVLIIQLDTFGGSIDTMKDIVQTIRDSSVPVVVYVSPRGAHAASAGTLITLAGHASAMAPETVIGAASPVGGQGEDLETTEDRKIKEDLKAVARSLAQNRGEKAIALAESSIEDAKAVSSTEALDAGLVDFVVDNVDDLLEALNGFSVQMTDGTRTLNTINAHTEPLEMSLIESLLLFFTNPNIVFGLLSLGTMAILFEISSPGGWVSGFFGVVCVTLALYGLGMLTVNWFGIVFLVTALVLFILDIKAPTHGALTAAGVASFIVGALVLFNSPGTPQFQRVSVPLVIGVGIVFGLMFFGILMFALRTMHVPVQMGTESLIGKTGTARTSLEHTGGQVQVESELWSAEPVHSSERIRKGDPVEVVEVKGLRLKVRKIK